MAQKVQTLFIDDLDGSEAEGTVRFGLDRTDYEIDLKEVATTSMITGGACRIISDLDGAEAARFRLHSIEVRG